MRRGLRLTELRARFPATQHPQMALPVAVEERVQHAERERHDQRPGGVAAGEHLRLLARQQGFLRDGLCPERAWQPSARQGMVRDRPGECRQVQDAVDELRHVTPRPAPERGREIRHDGVRMLAREGHEGGETVRPDGGAARRRRGLGMVVVSRYDHQTAPVRGRESANGATAFAYPPRTTLNRAVPAPPDSRLRRLSTEWFPSSSRAPVACEGGRGRA